MKSGGIKPQDIKVDLHCHSIEGSPRDAKYTVDELARFYSKALGFKYMVLTNHCWKKDPSWLAQTAAAVEQVKLNNPDFGIINGLELNIMDTGEIEIPEDIEDSQFNIASIHQRPHAPDKNVTQRLIRALENPYIDVIGHPGIYYEDYQDGIDWYLLAEIAKQLEKAIEITIYELLPTLDDPSYLGRSAEAVYILKPNILRAFAERLSCFRAL